MENELSKGFTGVEINEVRFSNISEMLQYMDKQREHIIKAKEIIEKYLAIGVGGKITQNYLDVTKEAEQFLKECK